MGHPKRRRKSYEKPKSPWEPKRIEEERELREKYGLKNKREIWKATSVIKKYRREIRKILAEIAGGKAAEHTSNKGKFILDGLKRKGVLEEEAKMEDALGMSIENLLERRLQTMVYKRGLSNSIKQARQFIVHGHVAVDGRKITIPSYIVEKEEESKIDFYGKVPFIKTEKKGIEEEERAEVKAEEKTPEKGENRK